MHYKGKIVQSSLWGTNKVLLLRQFPLDLEWHSSSPVLDAAQTCQASLPQCKLRLCYKIFFNDTQAGFNTLHDTGMHLQLGIPPS